MRQLIFRLAHCERGSTVTEYAMLVAVLALGIAFAVMSLPRNVWTAVTGLGALAS